SETSVASSMASARLYRGRTDFTTKTRRTRNFRSTEELGSFVRSVRLQPDSLTRLRKGRSTGWVLLILADAERRRRVVLDVMVDRVPTGHHSGGRPRENHELRALLHAAARH